MIYVLAVSFITVYKVFGINVRGEEVDKFCCQCKAEFSIFSGEAYFPVGLHIRPYNQETKKQHKFMLRMLYERRMRDLVT
jgi:hypothetical protein